MDGCEAPFWSDGEVLQSHHGDRGVTPSKPKAIDLRALNGSTLCYVDYIAVKLLNRRAGPQTDSMLVKSAELWGPEVFSVSSSSATFQLGTPDELVDCAGPQWPQLSGEALGGRPEHCAGYPVPKECSKVTKHFLALDKLSSPIQGQSFK